MTESGNNGHRQHGSAYVHHDDRSRNPVNGLIHALKPLYDYSWVVGLGAGFVVYLVLSLPLFGKTGDTPAS